MSGRFARAGLQILRHPRIVAVTSILLAAGFGLLLLRLRIDPDLEHLLPTGDPTLRLTRHLQGDSPPTRVLFVILRASDPRRLEAAAPRVAEALKASPMVSRVTATRTEFAGAKTDWVMQSPLHFVPEETLATLQARLGDAGRRAELESIAARMAEDPLGGKATVLADPLGLRWIFDEAADRLAERLPGRLRAGTPYLIVEQPALAFIRLLGREGAPNMPFSHAFLEDVRSRIGGALSGLDVQSELAGSYVSAVTQEAALKRDMIVETTVSTIAVLLYVWWFSRSLLAAHLVFVPVILAIMGSLAAGGAIFGPLTPIVVSSAAILIAQGIDFPVHFFCRYRAERATRDLEGALHDAQVTMARPFVGITVTTLAAFLSLLICRFPGFRQFGLVLSIGMLLCLIAALVLFPVMLMAVDRRVRPASERMPWIVRGAEALLRTRWRVPLAWVLLVTGLLSWGWVARSGVRIDLDLRNAMAPGDPGHAALERLQQDLGAALVPVYALVDGAMPLDELRSRVSALRSTGVIAAADGPQELIPSAAARDRVERFRRATSGWIEATLADLGRLGFRPEPFRKGLEAMSARFTAPPPEAADLRKEAFRPLLQQTSFETEGKAHHVVVLFASRSLWIPEARQRFDREVRARLGEAVPLFSAFHLPDHYSEVLNADAVRVCTLTAAGIVLLTLLSVGNLRDGFIALAPVVLATGMTLAAVVLMGGEINVINMAAIPIILAVGVDGGIHFMVRFRESEGRDPAGTIREVGPGIWGSAATTLLGFGSIATSVTPGMASMGYLVVVGTVTSVLASLFLLPGILKGRALPRS